MQALYSHNVLKISLNIAVNQSASFFPPNTITEGL